MRKTPTVRLVLPFLVVSLVVFIIFACFLIQEQILNTLSDTKRQQENKANRVATRLEEKLLQNRELVDILALNPLVQEGNSEIVKDLLEKIMDRSPLCEALIVIEHDSSLVAEVPEGLRSHYLDSDELTSLISHCELLYMDTAGEKKQYTLASVAQVQHDEKKGRIIIALLDLNYVAETTLLGNKDDKVSLLTEDNKEIVLFVPEHKAKPNPIPVIANILSHFIRQKAPTYLQGAALVPKPDWKVTVTKPYESFLANNIEIVFPGFRFFLLLFLPILIVLVLVILAIYYSRHYFRELALRDGLTGLYNHRFFQTTLHNLVSIEKRRKVSLLMIDLDDFKIYNDTYGHQAGDGILKKVANIMQKNIRNTDIAARYGGEEFAIILPDIGIREAIRTAERIREAIKTHCPCTSSIGVSSFPQFASNLEELIRGADDALYKAKDISKDRVEGIAHRTVSDQDIGNKQS